MHLVAYLVSKKVEQWLGKKLVVWKADLRVWKLAACLVFEMVAKKALLWVVE